MLCRNGNPMLEIALLEGTPVGRRDLRRDPGAPRAIRGRDRRTIRRRVDGAGFSCP